MSRTQTPNQPVALDRVQPVTDERLARLADSIDSRLAMMSVSVGGIFAVVLIDFALRLLSLAR